MQKAGGPGGDMKATAPRAKSFLNDEGGAMTIFAIVSFAFLMAMIGLIVDVSRIMNIHSQASSYADRTALAAAAELDGKTGALQRAVTAATGDGAGVASIVDAGFRFSLSGDNDVGIERMVFMSAIDADPADPYARSPLAGDTLTATWTPGGGFAYEAGFDEASATAVTGYVMVETTTETEQFLLFPIARLFLGQSISEASVAPQAVAGYVEEICNYVPMMICNPAETGAPGADFTPVRGQQIRAKMQGANAGWGPGVFGLLDALDGNGASDVREAFASREPNTRCVSTDEGADVKPGQNVGPVEQGLNVRFDRYDSNTKDLRGLAQYAPDLNVVKGQTTTVPNGQGNQGCGYSKSTGTVPYPRDNCFMPAGATLDVGISAGAGTGCTSFGGENRFGDGSWARTEYWDYNHPGAGNVPANFSTASRYDFYRHEIDSNQLVNQASENGAPLCAGAGIDERRVLYLAIINCLENAAVLNGNAEDVPVEAYAKVFLTEPVGTISGNQNWWGNSNADVYLEMIEEVGAGNFPQGLKEFAVLYR